MRQIGAMKLAGHNRPVAVLEWSSPCPPSWYASHQTHCTAAKRRHVRI